jgi:hypothetical protein
MYDETHGGVGVPQSRTVRSCGQLASFVVDIKFPSHEKYEFKIIYSNASSFTHSEEQGFIFKSLYSDPKNTPSIHEIMASAQNRQDLNFFVRLIAFKTSQKVARFNSQNIS